jgi:hypothetical protein
MTLKGAPVRHDLPQLSFSVFDSSIFSASRKGCADQIDTQLIEGNLLEFFAIPVAQEFCFLHRSRK